jgi:hypothetical protein
MKNSWGFVDTIEYYSNDEKMFEINNIEYNIKDLVKYSDISFEKPLSDKIKMIDLEYVIKEKRSQLLSNYLIKFEITNNERFSSTNSSLNGYIRRLWSDYKFYIFKDKISNTTKEYMKYLSRYDSSKYKFVKKVGTRKLYSGRLLNDGYVEILKLTDYDKSEWRERIKELQYFESLATDCFINLDEIEIDETWLDSIKKKRSRSSSYIQKGRRLEGEIAGKQAEALEKFVQGQDCKFVPTTYKLEGIHKKPALFIYSNHDDKVKLDALYKAVQKQKIKLVTFSDREVNKLKDVDIHNLITYKEFMKGENKPFKRIVTAYLIDKLMSNYINVFNRRQIIQKISNSMYEKLDSLAEYKSKHHVYHNSDNVCKAMLEVAENNNLFDYTIYPEYLEMKELLKKLDFLEPFIKSAAGNNYSRMDPDDTHNILCSLFKYYKHRIDYTNYKIKINEEEEGKKLSEEVVEDLVNN